MLGAGACRYDVSHPRGKCVTSSDLCALLCTEPSVSRVAVHKLQRMRCVSEVVTIVSDAVLVLR